MKYEPISFWPDAYHVIKQGQRVGIVNCHRVSENGRKKEIWFAHNKHFFSIGDQYTTRAQAASVLDTKAIHHGSEAFK